ncbi:MAG: acyl-ACP--UDP-N-acetylglucosamine O-acyltransferase [Planctomycetota bacterium]
MSVQIAPSAVVDPKAKLGSDVRIGHFCVVGPDVRIGDRTRIEDHVTVQGVTQIGSDNQIFSHVSIGSHPQDVSYRNTPTRVEIGSGNVLREQVTINRASEKEEGITSVGDQNYFMTGTHIGHDARVGSRIVMANNCMIAGHVYIDDDVTIAGGAGIHQFASVGRLSFVGAMSRIVRDVPPYMIVEGYDARPRCVNTVGLKRHKYSEDDIAVLSRAFKLVFRQKIGIEKARDALFAVGPIRPVLRHLFDCLDHTVGGRSGRGRDRRRKAA